MANLYVEQLTEWRQRKNSKRAIKAENTVMLVNKYNFSIQQSIALQKFARTLHTLHENACNYGLSKWQETRRNNIMNYINDIASLQDSDIHIQEQCDPRGWPLIINLGQINDSQLSSYDRICPFK